MHDCGLLGRMFPEFQAISCRVVRDFYHKYTVDEHTLLTIRNLERLADRRRRAAQRFRVAARAICASPELLVLALLLHDVGKWRDDDHAIESVRMAQRRCSSGCSSPADARDTVEFLIRHHLRMSLVAFRRDTEDPEIVKQFAALVGTEERLKMLCLLTLADVEAVSPETLTPWKEELLWRLYVDTYNHLTLATATSVIERDQAGRRELLAQPARRRRRSRDRARSSKGCRAATCSCSTRDAIYRHVRLARDIEPGRRPRLARARTTRSGS